MIMMFMSKSRQYILCIFSSFLLITGLCAGQIVMDPPFTSQMHKALETYNTVTVSADKDELCTLEMLCTHYTNYLLHLKTEHPVEDNSRSLWIGLAFFILFLPEQTIRKRTSIFLNADNLLYKTSVIQYIHDSDGKKRQSIFFYII